MRSGEAAGIPLALSKPASGPLAWRLAALGANGRASTLAGKAFSTGAHHTVADAIRKPSISGDHRAVSTPLITATEAGIAEGSHFASAFHNLAIIARPAGVGEPRHFGTAAKEGGRRIAMIASRMAF